MRIISIVIFLLNISLPVFSQSAELLYHKAASEFIHEENALAKQTVSEGLKRFPTDQKLNALKKLIKDQEKKNQDQQNKDQKEQEKKEQEKKEQEKKEQEQKGKQEKEQKEKKEQEAKESQKQEEQKEKKDNFNPDKLKDMKVTEEKAKMILEAMKNQEVQYLQQNRRKATKPKDKGKPDW